MFCFSCTRILNHPRFTGSFCLILSHSHVQSICYIYITLLGVFITVFCSFHLWWLWWWCPWILFWPVFGRLLRNYRTCSTWQRWAGDGIPAHWCMWTAFTHRRIRMFSPAMGWTVSLSSNQTPNIVISRMLPHTAYASTGFLVSWQCRAICSSTFARNPSATWRWASLQ